MASAGYSTRLHNFHNTVRGVGAGGLALAA